MLVPCQGLPRPAQNVLFCAGRPVGHQQPRQILPEPLPLRHVREKVIETGPRTPPADPEQPGTLSACSSPITGSQTRQRTYLKGTPGPLTSLDSTDYR